MNVATGLGVAAQAATKCLGVVPGDRVLILCNHPQRSIAEALAVASRARASDVQLLECETLSRDGEELPSDVVAAMIGASVIFGVTTYSISHTEGRLAATAAGARIAGMGGITDELFARTLPIDYARLRTLGKALADALSNAESCQLTSPGGTEVTLRIGGRQARVDDGHLQEPGAFGNLPAGEAYIAPIETCGDGTIVFDGALAGYGLLEEPLQLELRGGRAVSASGEAAEWLLSTLDAGGEHGRSIAEIGIGTNPGARICGEMLVDEKAAGSAHLAFGTSASFGGVNQATVHIDGLIREPTIRLDDVYLPLPSVS